MFFQTAPPAHRKEKKREEKTKNSERVRPEKRLRRASKICESFLKVFQGNVNTKLNESSSSKQIDATSVFSASDDPKIRNFFTLLHDARRVVCAAGFVLSCSP